MKKTILLLNTCLLTACLGIPINNKVVNMFMDEEINLKSNIVDYNYIYSSFKDLFEKAIESNSDWSPKGIEYIKEIEILNNQNKKVYYIDFDCSNGFLVGDSDTIYEFETNGDLVELRHLESFAYSSIDGFVIYNDEKYRYEKIYNNEFSDVICKMEEVLNTPVIHNGQAKEGDGQIYDLNSYVADRYPNYTLVESSYLKGYKWAYQMDNSVYVTNYYRKNGNLVSFSSEGNCVINATYSMLSNLPTVKNPYYYNWRYNENYFSGTNTMDYSVAVLADQLYADYGDTVYYETVYDQNLNENLDGYREVNYHNNSRSNPSVEDIPILYMQLRTVAIDEGYLPNKGMKFSKTKKLVEETDELYGYNIDFQTTSSTESVISNIKNGIPSLISTNGSETYDDHAMAVYGYAKYSYTVDILWWTETRYAYFWMVDSGHGPINDSSFFDENGNRINWFDPNQCSVSFGVIDRNSLTWPTC